MNAEELRKKLHDYVDNADEMQLESIYPLVQALLHNNLLLAFMNLKSVYPLGNITKDSYNNLNKDVRNIGSHHRQGESKKINQQVVKINKRGCNYPIPKKLNLPM